MLRKETVAGSTLELLKNLQSEENLLATRLVGGTALSLLIGHRTSEDLDLFTTELFDTNTTIQTLTQKYNLVPRIINKNTIIGDIGSVKIDIIYHPFQWIDDDIEEDGFRIATTKDIAAMKLHAIINNGERPKDFVDIAYLSQLFSYNEMKEFLLQKYPTYDPLMADRALTYFGDIDTSLIQSIKMLHEKLDFEKIKRRLIQMASFPYNIFKSTPLYVQPNRTPHTKNKGRSL